MNRPNNSSKCKQLICSPIEMNPKHYSQEQLPVGFQFEWCALCLSKRWNPGSFRCCNFVLGYEPGHTLGRLESLSRMSPPRTSTGHARATEFRTWGQAVAFGEYSKVNFRTKWKFVAFLGSFARSATEQLVILRSFCSKPFYVSFMPYWFELR